MKTIVAALDATAAARPVLEVGLALGRLMGAEVEAVHIRNGPTEVPETLAQRTSTPLRVLEGPVEPLLLEAVAAPGVIAAAMGARSTPGGRRPAGRTAMRVLERTTTPVAIVPPDIASSPRRGIRRLLLPLEGTEESSRPLVDQLFPLLAAEVELTVLHVFTPDTTPRILDRPHRDLAMWGHEFLARHCPMAERIEWRQGPIGHGAIELCDEQDVDLVVLSWSQDASPGRATVVREILARSRIPVLLLPTRPDAGA